VAEFVLIDPPINPLDPGNIPVATDRVTINGDPADAQRIKTGFGSDGQYSDVSLTTPLPVTPGTARNTVGSATGVAVSGTATVVAFVADAAFRCRGFIASGTADGMFTLRYNGAAQYTRQTKVSTPDVLLVLPEPDPPGVGVAVTITVVNQGDGSADFTATLLGV